jgi:hypothetical protein
MTTKKEQNVIKAKMCLLMKRMRLHEWTTFTGKEEEEIEEEEAKIDAGDFILSKSVQQDLSAI